jgi:glycosyltransferase involved in cell wall biosynthesis
MRTWFNLEAYRHIMYVSIVIPVHNEEASLEQLYGEITQALQKLPQIQYEVVFVDDGSTDASYAVTCRLFEADPEHVRVISLRRNFGQTAAMAAGFEAARGEVIIPMDGDLQNDPADIPELLRVLEEGYDVVSGWRRVRKDPFLSRRLPSQLANWLISWITQVHLHDYGCTLKAYRADLVRHMKPYGEQHRFLPALASWTGARVTEIPVNHRPRQYGRTKYGIGRTIRVLLDLITVKFLLSYSTNPMQVFGKWGFLAFLIGAGSGVTTAVLKILPPHQDVTDNPWIYIASFFLLGGLQLIALGLLGEINVRTYYESQSKPIYTIRATHGVTLDRNGVPNRQDD